MLIVPIVSVLLLGGLKGGAQSQVTLKYLPKIGSSVRYRMTMSMKMAKTSATPGHGHGHGF